MTRAKVESNATPFRRLLSRLRRAAPIAAVIAIPLTAVAQTAMSAGDSNPAATQLFVFGGWIMLGGIGVFCVIAFALALFPGLHRD
jgi:hypothetical protein